jgi:hypothetical protein
MSFETIRYKVIRLLKENPETRNSDKALLQEYYLKYEGIDVPLKEVQTNPVTIWRNRQKVQELNESLKGTKEVQEKRKALEQTYREEFKGVEG